MAAFLYALFHALYSSDAELEEQNHSKITPLLNQKGRQDTFPVSGIAAGTGAFKNNTYIKVEHCILGKVLGGLHTL